MKCKKRMYSSKRDCFIYGDKIPLYKVLHIKRTLKKHCKKNILDNVICENEINENGKRKISFD